MKQKIKVTEKSRAKFNYFAECDTSLRLEPVPFDPDGPTAEECFHSIETFGRQPPCSEPELLARALNGKARHGITVGMISEDYVDGLVSAEEVASEYPEWMQNEIMALACKVAVKRVGFIPAFVKSWKENIGRKPVQGPDQSLMLSLIQRK